MSEQISTQTPNEAIPETQVPPDAQNLSASGENARLDAMDALPENRRRGALVLGIIAILSVISIAVLIIMPPLSWTPEKAVASNFYALSRVDSVVPGTGDTMQLSYARIEEKVIYELELEQTTHYGAGNQSRVTVTADAELERPGRRESEDAVQIRFSNVSAHVYDGEEEVKLASAGAMLAGISLYSRLEVQDGLLSAVSDANINPQVARVLYVLADGMRQIWQPLPKEKVGQGATWRIFEELPTSEEANAKHPLDFRREVRVRVTEWSETAQTIDGEMSLSDWRNSKKRDLKGGGKSHMVLSSGIVAEGRFELHREDAVYEGGGERQEVKLEIRKKPLNQ